MCGPSRQLCFSRPDTNCVQHRFDPGTSLHQSDVLTTRPLLPVRKQMQTMEVRQEHIFADVVTWKQLNKTRPQLCREMRLAKQGLPLHRQTNKLPDFSWLIFRQIFGSGILPDLSVFQIKRQPRQQTNSAIAISEPNEHFFCYRCKLAPLQTNLFRHKNVHQKATATCLHMAYCTTHIQAIYTAEIDFPTTVVFIKRSGASIPKSLRHYTHPPYSHDSSESNPTCLPYITPLPLTYLSLPLNSARCAFAIQCKYVTSQLSKFLKLPHPDL